MYVHLCLWTLLEWMPRCVQKPHAAQTASPAPRLFSDIWNSKHINIACSVKAWDSSLTNCWLFTSDSTLQPIQMSATCCHLTKTGHKVTHTTQGDSSIPSLKLQQVYDCHQLTKSRVFSSSCGTVGVAGYVKQLDRSIKGRWDIIGGMMVSEHYQGQCHEISMWGNSIKAVGGVPGLLAQMWQLWLSSAT